MAGITQSKENLLALIREAMDDVFGENIYLKREENYDDGGASPLERDGYFRIEYVYRPQRFSIIWKGYLSDFKIKIKDESGAFCYISGDEPINLMLTERDIRKIAKKILRTIEEGPRFYTFRMGRLYRRVNGQWRKVRTEGGTYE